VVKRGEVWMVRLDPTEGREIQKTRPCVIVSPPEIHDHLNIVMAAPLTTGSRPAGFRAPIKFGGKDGLVLLEQIRALDKRRLIRRMGVADRPTVAALLAILREMFAD
jgi:mRNA interferase MazF